MLSISLRNSSEHGTQHCKTMHKTMDCFWPILLWWLSSPTLRIAFGLNTTRIHQRQPPCQPGKVHSVLAVRHGNIGLPFETKSVLYLLFACIVMLNIFKGYDYCPKGMKTVHVDFFL